MFNSKRLMLVFVFLLLIPFAFAAEPKIKTFVNDYAGVIDPASEQELEGILGGIYASGTAQYSIVTVTSLEGKAIESYALELAQGNLGDTETNNGLLLLVAIEERQYRFEVGRGIEYILNDAKVGRIGRTYLVPHFKQGNYGGGLIEASRAVQAIMTGDNESKYYVTDAPEYNPNYAEMVFWMIWILVLFVLPAILRYKKAKKDNRNFDAAMMAVILFGGRGRGGLGGGSMGGFGGFGGGGFGGGGASGGW